VNDASDRKLASKRFNERVKLLANALNALSIAAMATALLVPAISGDLEKLTRANVIWFLFGVVLHLLAHLTFSLLRSED